MGIKKKLLGDLCLNLLATAMPIVLLQLVLLPYIAGRMSEEQYGLMITIVSLITMVSTSFGNVLNNVRLLLDEKYNARKVSGDYNVILIFLCALNLIIMFVGTWYYQQKISFYDIMLNIIASTLWLICEYVEVDFRLNLNFRAILFNKLLLSVGYGLGTFAFQYSGKWQYIYILGQLCSLIYLMYKCRMLKEPLKFTPFFRETSLKSVLLLIASVFAKGLNYVDKLMLFPLLGGGAVSVYYVATLFGKIVAMGITPINSVALSYLNKMSKISRKAIVWVLTLGSVVCGIGYIVCILISKPILTVLYPQWVEEAMIYIPITTLTIVITVLCSILSPILLKFRSMYWQIVINGIAFLIYIIVPFSLVKQHGLMGFCQGILLTNIIKLVTMVIICLVMDKEGERKLKKT